MRWNRRRRRANGDVHWCRSPVQFSDLLQKLFVNMDKPCPVQFNVAVPDELSHYNICSCIVYARPEHQRSTSVHSTSTEATNQSTMAMGRATAAVPLIGSFVSLRRSAFIHYTKKRPLPMVVRGSSGVRTTRTRSGRDGRSSIRARSTSCAAITARPFTRRPTRPSSESTIRSFPFPSSQHQHFFFFCFLIQQRLLAN